MDNVTYLRPKPEEEEPPPGARGRGRFAQVSIHPALDAAPDVSSAIRTVAKLMLEDCDRMREDTPE